MSAIRTVWRYSSDRRCFAARKGPGGCRNLDRIGRRLWYNTIQRGRHDGENGFGCETCGRCCGNAVGCVRSGSGKVAEYDIDNLGCGGIVYLGGDNYYLLQDHDDSTKKATLYPATIQVDPSTGKITNNLKIDIATSGIALTGNGDSKPGGDRPRQSLLRDPLFAENMKTRG